MYGENGELEYGGSENIKICAKKGQKNGSMNITRIKY